MMRKEQSIENMNIIWSHWIHVVIVAVKMGDIYSRAV